MKNKYWLALGGGVLFILWIMSKKWIGLAASVIASFESFSPIPYWDVSRYSWGYGTPAPGPTGTISKAQAMADLVKHVLADYQYLAPKVTRTLSPNQWAAYLSFSYNLGTGNADNLIEDINAGDDTVLEPHWKEYVYAGGQVNQDLVTRRNREWRLWAENIF